ncbi:hypothetical protein IT400_04265 [Candidatus Nomurabacteria bacterium]|nr:hypothetical protein [Candidatus Nomurabacteria bacterium]
MIDKKSKLFLTIFFILVIISVTITFYRYLIIKKFTIITDEEAFSQSLLEK